MARVLVGRPRCGARLRLKRRKRHQGQTRRFEDALRREPMSCGRGTKYLNENLAPLERYLRSQVGRPWDAVYSEICARLRPTSAVQQHVRDHLADFVVVRTWCEGDELMGQPSLGAPIALLGARWAPRFYVDPRSGLLRERRRRRERRRTRQPDPDVRWDGPWRQLRRIAGVWYALRLAPVPADAALRMALRDRLHAGRTLAELLREPEGEAVLVAAYGRGGVYAAEKRQLSKRELRRIDALPWGHEDEDG